MKKTKVNGATYNARLDQYYSGMPLEQVQEELDYLTNKSRARYTSKATIYRCWREGGIGKLIQRLDPVAWHYGKQEFEQGF